LYDLDKMSDREVVWPSPKTPEVSSVVQFIIDNTAPVSIVVETLECNVHCLRMLEGPISLFKSRFGLKTNTLPNIINANDLLSVVLKRLKEKKKNRIKRAGRRANVKSSKRRAARSILTRNKSMSKTID
jgi:hypothetical protein